MKSLITLSSFLAMAVALPQDISVVRPNHYLQPGTFGKDQHLLPQSFFTPGEQVNVDFKNIETQAAAASQPQASVIAPESQSSVPATSAQGSAESTGPDSYSNIGGTSGNVASALNNIHEYGETVPKAFSNLEHDSYAYYHGHRTN